jgi:hypothetical protein
MSNLIEIQIIWARFDDEPEVIWAVDAWDEYSIDNNYGGWEEAQKKAAGKSQTIRVTRSLIDMDAVEKAFGVATADITETEPVAHD